MGEPVGEVTVECPSCGWTVRVEIVATDSPVNELGQLRVGIAPRYSHECPPVPPGPGDGERVAA